MKCLARLNTPCVVKDSHHHPNVWLVFVKGARFREPAARDNGGVVVNARDNLRKLRWSYAMAPAEEDMKQVNALSAQAQRLGKQLPPT